VKTKILVTVSFLTLLAVVSAYGQNAITANIAFQFTAGGKMLPAGQYQFIRDANDKTFRIAGPKGASALVPIMTRLGAAIHTSPQDSHIVFDKVGESYTLSEIWIPGQDGYMLNMMKEKHEHRTVDTGNPK
jgi:hypothetical protein